LNLVYISQHNIIEMADLSCKLFVRNLSYRTTDRDLKEFYGKFGSVDECAVMKDKQSGKSKGFGFVRFLKPAMVDEAMANRPHELDDKKLEPHRAAPKEYSAKPESHHTCNDIFVGGVKKGLSEQEVRDYFGNYGTIVKVNIPKNKQEPEKTRGFAVVTFDDYDPVDVCCHKKWHNIKQFRLDVTKYIDKKDMDVLVQKYGNGIDDGWGRPKNFDQRRDDNQNNRRGGGGGGFQSNNRGSFGGFNSRGRGGNQGGQGRSNMDYNNRAEDILNSLGDDYNSSDLLDRAILTQRALLARSIADLDYGSGDVRGPVKSNQSYGRKYDPYNSGNRGNNSNGRNPGQWM